MDSWNYYPKSSPRQVSGGIKARSKRGSIGEAWWSQRFIKALEQVGNAARLQRGKRYARQGQVIGIKVADGAVQAEVQGSSARPYRVTIRLRPLTDAAWNRVFDRMSAQAVYAAELLAGVVPHEIETVFEEAGAHLFPASKNDLETGCTCPDWENPCKHIAAVYYLLAERFDEDPFLLFALRGRSREEVVAALRERRSGTPPTAESAPPSTVRFWQGGDAVDGLAITITGEAGSEGSALKILGEAPFSVGGRNLAEVLAPAYPAAQRYARRTAGVAERQAGE
ncbi:SWIM zinc finger family protein [Methanoculleus frigidifontis]|nr:SWIM zinc finger family protein [Methanoculleus sp. FWC-SCC1]